MSYTHFPLSKENAFGSAHDRSCNEDTEQDADPRFCNEDAEQDADPQPCNEDAEQDADPPGANDTQDLNTGDELAKDDPVSLPPDYFDQEECTAEEPATVAIYPPIVTSSVPQCNELKPTAARDKPLSPIAALRQVIQQGDIRAIHARRSDADQYCIEGYGTKKDRSDPDKPSTSRDALASDLSTTKRSSAYVSRTRQIALPGMGTDEGRNELLAALARRKKD